MSSDEIKNLEEVLSKQLGPDKKIIEMQTTPLNAKGENFGSTMLKLDVKLRSEKDGTEQEIHAVAKMLPADEMSRKVFNVQVSVKNEIAMYTTITPTLQEFQREHGVTRVVDYVPEFYGGRLNMGGKGDLVDDDSVIIMENLKESGYINVDRHVGFDLDTGELILKDLAAFHAVPLALKLKKPEVFDEKVRPYLTKFTPPDPPANGENGQTMDSIVIEMLQESDKCIPHVSKVRALLKRTKEIRMIPPNEPFATVVHGDMWVNNTMVKFVNGKPVKNKLVDFQVCDYGSPATDLFFFLFSSIRLRVLQDHFDDLVKFYHNHFISHLDKLGCDIAPFNYHNFLEEMRFATENELQHSLIMTLFIVFGKKGGPSQEFNHEEPPDFEKMKREMTLEAKEKIRFMVQVCGKKGWL